MRLPLVILLFGGILLALALWRVWATMPRGSRWRRGYVIFAVIYILWMGVWVVWPKGLGDERSFEWLRWLMFGWIALFAAQAVYALVSLVVQGIASLSRVRRPWPTVRIISGACALSILVIMAFGTWVTRHNIEVRQVTVPVEGLPAAFDGYRIVQLSDIHVEGLASDTTYIRKIVDATNALRPDLIVFTGDLVTRRARELEPCAAILSQLKARDGVYSILGNHDYEDYVSWPTSRLKASSHRHLLDLQRAMGWQVLRDSTAYLRRGADSVALIGVENIGDPPFHCYGSLARAYPNIGDSLTKILLTHNPVHWTDSIASHPHSHIALTLSGHTHAMQMKFGRWSPSSMRYRTPEGLYRDDRGQYLYVNPGLGTVGYPMRIGTRPQITLITMHNSQCTIHNASNEREL